MIYSVAVVYTIYIDFGYTIRFYQLRPTFDF